MERVLDLLRGCPLFAGFREERLREALAPLAELRTYARESVVISPQKRVDWLGVVASGRLHIVQLFSDGSRSLMDTRLPCQPLGADLICAEGRRAPYHVVAATNAEVLLLPSDRLLDLLTGEERQALWRQLLAAVSRENMQKHYRLAILSRRGLRERILIYLTMETGQRGARTLPLPFSREELAEFLCVNRSALSHELSKMAQEGLIRFRKNQFTLLEAGAEQSVWQFLGQPDAERWPD